MARARRRQRKTRRKKTRPAPKRRIRVTVPRPTRAETLLLALAKDLAGAPLDGALRKLADAFAPSAELPREVYGAWIKSRREKTASLALSWAREQVRLSLEETIARSPRGRPAVGLTPDMLAWLLLAACAACGRTPPEPRTRSARSRTGRRPSRSSAGAPRRPADRRWSDRSP